MGKAHQRGFSIVEIIIAVVVLAVIGFIAWRLLSGQKLLGPTATDDKGTAFVEWNLIGDAWQHSGTAPACEDPLAIAAPMDVSKATSKLLPGQNRGGDFKPHGGLAIDTSPDGKIDITAVRDAFLYRGARYIQDGEVQYMFDFMDSCGVMYRLDHLAKLTDQFASFAAKLPEPQPDDSRTYKFDDNAFIKKGTIIATEIGISNPRNPFFDLGVYDLRQPNAASKTDLYKTDQLRISDKEQSFYAVCWFDLLPESDKSTVINLPGRDGSFEGTSDYCPHPWPSR